MRAIDSWCTQPSIHKIGLNVTACFWVFGKQLEWHYTGPKGAAASYMSTERNLCFTNFLES